MTIKKKNKRERCKLVSFDIKGQFFLHPYVRPKRMNVICPCILQQSSFFYDVSGSETLHLHTPHIDDDYIAADESARHIKGVCN